MSNEIPSEEAWTLNRLEGMLEDTAVLVRRRGTAPAKEKELQDIMHDYLRACFPDFIRNLSIVGALKTFKPDCGISSVRAAIEFKIVRSETDVKTAFSGIAEDASGYKGSKDWTRFYAVIYQAEPFMSVRRLRHDLKRIGATTWTAYVVNGRTKREKDARKKASAEKGEDTKRAD